MWFWYAFSSALVSAVSVILNKKALNNISASLVSWALFSFSIPLLIYPALKDGLPKLNTVFWLATLASVFSFAYLKTLALKSLKGSLVSEVVPLAFFGIVLQYLLALVSLSETIKIFPLIGLVLIIVGGYFLKVEEARENFFKPFKTLLTNKGSRAYLFAVTMMPLTSIFDKFALKNIRPVNQSFLLLLENIMMTVLISFYIIGRDKKWVASLKNNFWNLSLNGIVYTVLALLYLYGITEGPVALVSGIKKLEVFFVLVFAWFVFGDKPRKSVWLGSLIMLAGVILIKAG